MGNRRALARAISLVEDDQPEGPQILSDLYAHTGRAHVIGVTGSPGAGKSTLVNALARSYRAAGLTVGVIAVDPSSPFSGGALLGDRIRMRDLTGDPGVFIRSMASRGSLGGLARATFDVVQLMDAAGFDRILVETVGAGQAEVEIAEAAHTTIVVEAPGMGDEVQTFKAGLLEIADILVVNKADRSDVDRTVLALQAMQSLGSAAAAHHHLTVDERPGPGRQPDGSWLPPIVKTVAAEGRGIETVRGWAEEHARYLRETNGYARHEGQRAAASIRHILYERLPAMLLARLPEGYWERMIRDVVNRDVAPHAAVDALLRAGNWLG